MLSAKLGSAVGDPPFSRSEVATMEEVMRLLQHDQALLRTGTLDN